MNIWITTDNHFDHERMSEHCGRPKGYEAKILSAIRKTVKEKDLLINLGDFCWHRDAYWHEQYMLHALCKNWLTVGNHDGKKAGWYITHGWDWAGESCLVEFYGKKILFSHLPQPDGDYDYNIHGHFHNTDRKTQLETEPEIVARLTDKHILIAIENTNYQPVELGRLLAEHQKSFIQKEGG
jgi:calcineurin-like phosphoesterase family protein